MIIGISGKKQSGKDTISDYLIEKYNFIKYGFADPIKEIARIIFGFTDEQLFGKDKEKIDSFWGIKPRDFFQKFGTDYGQFVFPEHFPNIFQDKDKRSLWVMIFKKWYLQQIEKNPSVKIIINDVRFEHEFNCIKELGGYIFRVQRSNYSYKDIHISENELDMKNKEEFNSIIINDGTKEELYEKLIEIIN